MEQTLTWVVDKNRESREVLCPVKFSMCCRNDVHCSEHLQLCKSKHSSEILSIEAEEIKMDKAVASVSKTMPLLFFSG